MIDSYIVDELLFICIGAARRTGYSVDCKLRLLYCYDKKHNPTLVTTPIPTNTAEVHCFRNPACLEDPASWRLRVY